MREVLVEGYAATGPALDPSLLARCRALALLRLACVHQDAGLAELAGHEAAGTAAGRPGHD